MYGEDISGANGMKGLLAGAKTGLKFRIFVATIADTQITAVTGKYKGADARAFTITDFIETGKKFGVGEFFNFGDNFVMTGITIATGGGINIVHIEPITPTPAA